MIKRSGFYTYILILFLVFVDQLSKAFLISYLKTQPGYTIEALPFLDIVYAWNYGISFGLFREYYQYSNAVFLILSSAITLYLAYLIFKVENFLQKYGLLIIVGGAIGNLIDRIIRGAVFDFIYFNYQNYSFPAFNLADAFITIGACIFIYDYLARGR